MEERMLENSIEEWRPIPEWIEFYEVSNLGRVRSLPGRRRSGRILNGHTDKDGYLRVMLCVDRKQKNAPVSRLVASAFIPNPSRRGEVNHINGVKRDNRAINLEWCNRSENMIHAYQRGLRVRPVGALNGRSKATSAPTLSESGAAR